MANLTQLLEPYMGPAMAGLGLTTLVALLITWAVHRRFARLQRRFDRLTQGVEIGNIEEILVKHLDEMRSFTGRLATLETHASATDIRLACCIQSVGLVRFDAFDDVGGRQSFSCALLDAHRSGLVISGLYARSDVRVYVKQLDKGVPSIALTAEESAAVAQAAGGIGGASVRSEAPG
ncbi:MAG: DUF4446 family protein [Armatimonadetes bacterium]|nr:DUF4446 family protein [Armatimonadota bacterium]